MTPEQKAKSYDLAIEAAKKYHNGTLKDVMETIFPELKESEDERVRKALIDFFYRGAENGEQTNGVCDKDILAWLERQKEFVSADFDDVWKDVELLININEDINNEEAMTQVRSNKEHYEEVLKRFNDMFFH